MSTFTALSARTGIWVDLPWGAARLRREFVCRVSGLPVGVVLALRADGLVGGLRRLLELEEHIQQLGATISAKLYVLVGEETDRHLRRRLIRLRRDCYKGAAWPMSELETLQLPDDVRRTIAELSRCLEEGSRSRAELGCAYEKALNDTRARFSAELTAVSFRSGLLLSSPSLFAALNKYTSAAASRARMEKIERALLRYYTRTSMKATPFGTLCTVIGGTFEPVSDEEPLDTFQFSAPPNVGRSYVRLNKRLFGVFLEYIKRCPTIVREMETELNPTIRRDGSRLVCLTARDGLEVFQRVALTATLEVVIGKLAGGGTATPAALVRMLENDGRIESSAEEAHAYVQRLLDIGFLRVRTGIREQDPDWDIKLRALLSRVADEDAQLIAELLGDLRTLARKYAIAEPEYRAVLLGELRSLLDQALQRLGIEQRPDRELPLYEDATADAVLQIRLRRDWEDVMKDLAQLVHLTGAVAWPRAAQATMRHFFDTHYGSQTDAVSLLVFYEEYYRLHFKAHLERENEGRVRGRRGGAPDDSYDVRNPFALEYVKRMHRAQQAIADLIGRRWYHAPKAEALHISMEDLEECCRGLPEVPSPCRSVAFFAQVLPKSERQDNTVVLPKVGYTTGYGKYYSRFLYMLPAKWHKAVLVQNQSLTPDRWAEICGDAHFNANLHPPLFRWEISYPTGESGVTEEQIASGEIDVVRDEGDEHALALRHRATGARIIPIDLGFLNQRKRPPMYQLLARFAPAVTFALPLPSTPLRHGRGKGGGPRGFSGDTAGGLAAAGTVAKHSARARGRVSPKASEDLVLVKQHGADDEVHDPSSSLQLMYRPRIVLAHGLVLARRQWRIPGALLPERAKAENAVDFLLKVQRWRQECGIPEQVYMKMRYAASRQSDASRRTAGPDREPGRRDSGLGSAPDATALTTGRTVSRLRRRPARSRNLWKPQYVDFSSPLLVALFGDVCRERKGLVVVIEECLPQSHELPEHGQDRYATEIIGHLDVFQRVSDSRGEQSGGRW